MRFFDFVAPKMDRMLVKGCICTADRGYKIWKIYKVSKAQERETWFAMKLKRVILSYWNFFALRHLKHHITSNHAKLVNMPK